MFLPSEVWNVSNRPVHLIITALNQKNSAGVCSLCGCILTILYFGWGRWKPPWGFVSRSSSTKRLTCLFHGTFIQNIHIFFIFKSPWSCQGEMLQVAKGSTVLNINKLLMNETNKCVQLNFIYVSLLHFNLSSSHTKLSLLFFWFQVPILAYPDPYPFVL